MKPCLIKQPAGIGDVFFCQKIARIMMQHGYKIIWPLRPDIHWIQRYIKDIWFPMTTDEFPMKDIFFRGAGAVVEETGAFISPATADMTHNDGKIMSSKYSMVGLDHSDWKDYFKFERNTKKEDELYYDILGLKDDSEFVFINNLYNTDIRDCELLSPENYDLPAVELKIIEGTLLSTDATQNWSETRWLASKRTLKSTEPWQNPSLTSGDSSVLMSLPLIKTMK